MGRRDISLFHTNRFEQLEVTIFAPGQLKVEHLDKGLKVTGENF